MARSTRHGRAPVVMFFSLLASGFCLARGIGDIEPALSLDGGAEPPGSALMRREGGGSQRRLAEPGQIQVSAASTIEVVQEPTTGTGPQGPPGLTVYGQAGPPGPVGSRGSPGPEGGIGAAGNPGASLPGRYGSIGKEGLAGEVGPVGRNGLQGDQGPEGAIGDQPDAVELFEQELNHFKKRVNSLDKNSSYNQKQQSADLVKMYGQVALFQDRAERLGLSIGAMNRTTEEIMKKLRDTDDSGKDTAEQIDKVMPKLKELEDTKRLMPLILQAGTKTAPCKGHHCERREAWKGGAAPGARRSGCLLGALLLPLLASAGEVVLA